MGLLANPSWLFIFVWTLILYLYSMQPLNIYSDLHLTTVGLIFTNIVIATILLIAFRIKYCRVALLDNFKKFLNYNFYKIKKFASFSLSLYVCISILDIVFSKGLPLIWALTGDTRLYVDFGIPTLHGLANSILFFLSSFLLLLTLLKVKSYKTTLFFLFIYQILILSRGCLIVMTVQMLSIYFFLYKGSVKKSVFFIIFIILFVIGFGLLGDLRSGDNPYYKFLHQDWIIFFGALPSGFLWVYVYLTSGLNNLNFNMDLIEPVYLPVYTFAKLVPTILYSYFGIEKLVDNYIFVNESLNVSTIYSAFYSDWGFLAFIPISFIQCVASISFYFARKGNVYALLSYTVSFQAIALSFFIDTFFYIPFLFQFTIIYLLKVYLNVKKTT